MDEIFLENIGLIAWEFVLSISRYAFLSKRNITIIIECMRTFFWGCFFGFDQSKNKKDKKRQSDSQ
jgi:hypothetical protein